MAGGRWGSQGAVACGGVGGLRNPITRSMREVTVREAALRTCRGLREGGRGGAKGGRGGVRWGDVDKGGRTTPEAAFALSGLDLFRCTGSHRSL